MLDTNVLVAAAVPLHPHHESSNAIVARYDPLCIAGHSLAEFMSTVTRPGLFDWSGPAADQQIRRFASIMRVLTLSPQTLVDVTSVFALQGFKGPLIYDWLIGQHAVKHEIGTLVTWNIKHMHRLFPEIAVQTPSQFLETL